LITLRLREPGRLGDKITFMLPTRWYESRYDSNPLVNELQSLVLQANLPKLLAEERPDPTAHQ
jgi:hypothetical protein